MSFKGEVAQALKAVSTEPDFFFFCGEKNRVRLSKTGLMGKPVYFSVPLDLGIKIIPVWLDQEQALLDGKKFNEAYATIQKNADLNLGSIRSRRRWVIKELVRLRARRIELQEEERELEQWEKELEKV